VTLPPIFHSRKFQAVLLDTVIGLLLYYNAVPAEVIAILKAPFLFYISGVALEDAAKARSAGEPTATPL
jgi:hypothetical protein